MTNHTFGEWVNGENNLYSKKKINDSLKKNSLFVEKMIKWQTKINQKLLLFYILGPDN